MSSDEELDQVNEESTAYVTIQFFDKNDVLAQPTSATYLIHDSHSGRVMRASTALVPTGGVVEVTIEPAENAILNTDLPSEIRVLTTNAVYGADDELNDEFRWRVINLKHAP